jgi:hypothetical protein
MCAEIKVGKSFVTGIVEGNSDFSPPVETGTFDPNILCIPCDGILGKWESAAIDTFREIRKQAVGMRDDTFGTLESDTDSILRFCAGVLYKYSLTTVKFGRIELGPYQELLRKVAFGETDVPPFLNVALLRLRLHPNDDSVFAYRAPKNDRDKTTGANMFRVLAGGVLMFIRVDKRPTTQSPLRPLWLRGRDDVIFSPVRAQNFEEFKIPQRILRDSERLQAILPD